MSAGKSPVSAIQLQYVLKFIIRQLDDCIGRANSSIMPG
jgi:hypothetical protein